jgi:hypothetical protein
MKPNVNQIPYSLITIYEYVDNDKENKFVPQYRVYTC